VEAQAAPVSITLMLRPTHEYITVFFPEFGKELQTATRKCNQLQEQPSTHRTSETVYSQHCGAERNADITRRGTAQTDAMTVTDPADEALFWIVSMGFPPRDAREALMMTDDGVGHNVSLAVEYLLER
jgi:hypothetical protein